MAEAGTRDAAAARLHISFRTLRSHLAAARTAVYAKSTIQAYYRCVALGWIPLEPATHDEMMQQIHEEAENV